MDSAVLIVPVVTEADTDGSPKVVANAALSADAIDEIESALRALGAKGGAEQVTRLVAPSLPVASVLAVGLGAVRDEWPADAIRRAAGSAARSLSRTDRRDHAERTRFGGRDRGTGSGRLPVHRVPQRQDRLKEPGWPGFWLSARRPQPSRRPPAPRRSRPRSAPHAIS